VSTQASVVGVGVGIARAPRIQLFGSFRLTVDGSPVPLALGVQRLLAALALRERMSRVRLAAMLWPQTSQRQSQANLRKAFWRLHHDLPGHALVVGDGQGLALMPGVGSDVGAIVSAVHRRLAPLADGRGSSSDVAGGVPAASALEELVHPEAVELLPDWDDPWLDVDRERLRQLRLHLLEEWAARLTEQGDYGLALEVALCALRTDALRESAHRAVIKVHRAEGNVEEARRAFATCSAVLSREIGVAPSQATVALVP
jgi:DNA-binding SARP family transcriptional activator